MGSFRDVEEREDVSIRCPVTRLSTVSRVQVERADELARSRFGGLGGMGAELREQPKGRRQQSSLQPPRGIATRLGTLGPSSLIDMV